MLMRCRMFEQSRGDFSPLANVIALVHVVQANDYPIILQDENGANRRELMLVLVRFTSGEVIKVESTPELREALNLGPESEAVRELLRLKAHKGTIS